MKRLRFVAGILLLAAAGCSSINPYYDASKPHHTADGFRNNYPHAEIGAGVLKWNWQRLLDGLPKPPANQYRFPIDQPDVGWLGANRSETTVTWIGHASALVQMHGVNILTDPVFSKRASPFSFAGPERKVPLPLTLEQLPRIDIVVISHNHYDHLDLESVQALARQPGGAPQFFVPLGLKSWMFENGITNVVEMDWWDRADVHGLQVYFVPAQHWSVRTPFDRNETLWGGWVIRTAPDASLPFSFFFAGDTGYSKDFAHIGKKFGPLDLALLPIGAYAPRWFMAPQHIAPDDAVKIHRDLRAKKSIGIHWGTFELADEALDEPPAVLAKAAAGAGLAQGEFVVPRHGQTIRF